jgi:uncharacterized protein (DUF4415 family)
VKSKRSRRTRRDPHDPPEITREWVAGADLDDGKKLVKRGRSAGTARNTQTTVRISNEVLAFFRASGRGWQTRMDAALKKYVAARQPKASRRRAGRYTSQDVHNALFPEKAPKGGPADVKEAIRTYIRKRHALP